jgi:hypothetical protein
LHEGLNDIPKPLAFELGIGVDRNGAPHDQQSVLAFDLSRRGAHFVQAAVNFDRFYLGSIERAFGRGAGGEHERNQGHRQGTLSRC